jgi:adenylate cyclase class IV
MPRNVEIKARVRDPDSVRARAQEPANAPAVVLEQEDAFFWGPEGRLKLRVFPDGKGELIAYRRPDVTGPKTSTSDDLIPQKLEDGKVVRLRARRPVGLQSCIRNA